MATFISRKPKQRGKLVMVTARRPLKGLTTSHDFFEKGERKKMAKIHPIDFKNIGHLGVDDNNKLYWYGQPIITEEKIKLAKWVNISIVIGAISTALYAFVTILDYLGIYIL
jgi:hypothetical protein